MKYYDIDKIAGKNGINNKYLLATIVSVRARQISQKKDHITQNKNEKYISLALDDLDNQRITFQINKVNPSSDMKETETAGEDNDVTLEE